MRIQTRSPRPVRIQPLMVFLLTSIVLACIALVPRAAPAESMVPPIRADLTSQKVAQSTPLGAFSLRIDTDVAPFKRIVYWAPPADPSRPVDLLVLLHGMQDANLADPNWWAWLRTRSPFQQTVLIVPAIHPGSRWGSPDAIAAIGQQLDAFSKRYKTSRERTWLVGFSAGAQTGFKVAAALASRIGGFAAVAGLPLGVQSEGELKSLAKLKILMVCMENDAPRFCDNQPVKATLERGGKRTAATRVETTTIPGIGHDCNLDLLAPVLSSWMEGS